MASEKLEEKNIIHLLQAASHLVRFTKKQMWLDYDDRLVGITILDASKR